MTFPRLLIGSMAILSGLTAIVLTALFAWVLIEGTRDTHADYRPQHYAGPVSTARGWDGR